MTDAELQDAVLTIVAKQGGLDRSTLSLDAKLSDLGIGSLTLVQILFEIEETFQIYIPLEGQRFRFAPLGELCDGIKALMAARDA